METEHRSFYWGANRNNTNRRNIRNSNHSERENDGFVGKDEKPSFAIHNRQQNIKVWFRRFEIGDEC